jgi:hypothetical protein
MCRKEYGENDQYDYSSNVNDDLDSSEKLQVHPEIKRGNTCQRTKQPDCASENLTRSDGK